MTKSGVDKKTVRAVMERLFYVLLAWELIYEVLHTTPFPSYAMDAIRGIFPGVPSESLDLFSRCVGDIRLLMIVPAIHTILAEMKLWRERVIAAVMILLGLLSACHLRAWRDDTVLMLMLLVVAAYGKSFRRIASCSIAIVGCLYVLTAVICIFGLIPEYNLIRGARIRHSLGFYGITTTAAYMCFVLLLIMFLKSGILHWYDYLLIALVSGFNLWLVDGRVALISTLLATAGALLCGGIKKHGWKLPGRLMSGLRGLLCASPLLIALSYFALVFGYSAEGWDELGRLPLLGVLKGRVEVPGRLAGELPFSFFGNYLAKYEYIEKNFYLYPGDPNILESSYARLYFIYGAIGLCLALFIYTVIQWRLMKKAQTYRMFVLFVCLVFFLVQKGIFNPGNNIFPLLFAAVIPAAQKAPAQAIYVGKRDANGVLLRAYEGVDMWEVYRKKPLAYKVVKRLLDIVGSIVAMILLSPAFIATAIAIKLEDGGPIVYSGQRYGKDMKRFPMHKFRSMCRDAEKKTGAVLSDEDKNGLAFKIKDDPRITRVGAFIRRTSIDELPQFWNVLKGQMSLVGPRPIQTTDKEIEPYEKQRWAVKPGITCIWQVCGRALVPWDEWVEMDLKYISEMSVKTDIMLMWETIGALWRKEGAM